MPDERRMADKIGGGYRRGNDNMNDQQHGLSPVDRLLEQKLLNDLRRNPPPQAAPSNRSRIKAGKKPEDEPDNDLMSSLMKRLAAAERELKLKNQELLRVKGERDVLEDRVQELEQDVKERDERLEGFRDQPAQPANAEDLLANLRNDNLLLRQQNERAWNEVGHLKEFLNDYGLVWVGEKDGEQGDARSQPRDGGAAKKKQQKDWQQYQGGRVDPPKADGDQWHPAPPKQQATDEAKPAAASALPIDLGEFEERLKDLNALAGDGCFDVVPLTRGGAQLRPPEPVSLLVYEDGIQLHNLKFRKYEERVCKSLVDDIMDGYFPSALKHEFPDGVPIRLVDRSSEPFPTGFRAFQGQAKVLSSCTTKPNPSGGYTLGGGGRSAVETGRRIQGLEDVMHGAHKPQEAQQFLNKLPASVIKNGKIINIRSDIADMIQPKNNPHEMAFVNTPVDHLLNTRQRNHAGPVLPRPAMTSRLNTGSTISRTSPGKGSPSSSQITTLQVKREDGGQVYIVKLRFDNTVSDLCSALDAHRAEQPGFANILYQVRTAFPSRVYDDPDETLETAGLVPNAVLFLKAVEPI